MKNKNRIWALIVLLLVAMPTGPLLGLKGPVELVAAGAGSGNTFDNFTITSPAWLQLNLWWDDGGGRFEALDLDDFITYMADSAGTRTVHTNPIPTMASETIRVRIYAKSNFTGGILYDINYTSGAAGSIHVQSISFDTGALALAIFIPVKVLFRPFDSATGAGLPVEQFNITVQFPSQGSFGGCVGDCYNAGPEIPIGAGQLETYYGLNVTVRARDYFGNLLYNQTRKLALDNTTFCNAVAGGNPGECGLFTSHFITWDIPLTVYSVKFYNQKPDQFTKFNLHWNGTGAGEEIFAPNGGLNPPWWDSRWTFREAIRIVANDAVPVNYTLNLSLSAASLVQAGKMLNDYRDLRVVYWNGTAWAEVNRSYNGTSLYWHSISSQGPNIDSTAKGAWHFQEGTGTTTTDSSGNGGAGTLINGPTWTTDPFGGNYALSFDGSGVAGTGDYVSVPNSAALKPGTGSWTVEFWMKRLGTGSGDYPQIIGSRPWTSAQDKGWTVAWESSSGRISTHFADGAAHGWDVTEVTADSVSTATLNVWEHWGVVFDRTNSKLVFYKNGKVDVERFPSFTSLGAIDQTNNIYIGREIDGTNNRMLNAVLDNISVFNYVRNPEQIGCDANWLGCVSINASTTNRDYYIYYGNPIAGTAPSFNLYTQMILAESGLLAYWPANETAGSTSLTNLQGSGNFALSNSPTLGGTSLINTGISFDGTNDYGQATIDFNSYSKFTGEFWQYSTVNSGSVVFEYGTNYNTNNGQFAVVWSDGSIANGVFVGQKVAGGYNWKVGTALVNQWNHVVFQFDSTASIANQIRIWINGTEATYLNTRNDATIVAFGTQTLNLASRSGTGSFYNGKTDEMAFYNGLLTNDQIFAHYNQGRSENVSLTKPNVSLDSQPGSPGHNLSQGFAWFNSPGETVERFLNPGYYEVTITTDNRTGPITKATLGFNVTEANYFMVSGTNITRFIGDFFSIYSQTVAITNAFRPDVITIGTLLPRAPTELKFMSEGNEDFIRRHPFSILTGTVAYASASGTNVTSYMPAFDSTSDDGQLITTLTVKKDRFDFNGLVPAQTHVWINYTSNGTNIWENSTLPPTVTLNGIQGDVYVVTNQTVSTVRISEFEAIWEFSFRWYPTTKKYEATLSMNNTMNRTVIDPKWYVGFPENSSVDLTTVALEDLDNLAWLTAGQHFQVGQSGYYMAFDQFNASLVRRFFFTFYDLNASELQSVPVVTIDSLTQTTFRGSTAYWTGTGNWANPFTAPYRGEIIVKLSCVPECEDADVSTLVVVNAITGQELDPTEFYTSGNDIHITANAVGTVVVGGGAQYTVYTKRTLTPSTSTFGVFTPFFVLGPVPFSLYVFLLIAEGVLVFLAVRRSKDGKVSGAATVLAVTLGGTLFVIYLLARLSLVT